MTGLLIITTPIGEYSQEEMTCIVEDVILKMPNLFIFVSENNVEKSTFKLIRNKKQIRTEHVKLKNLMKKLL